MTEYKSNTYADEDMKSVIDQIEALEAEKVSIMSAAMGECSAVAEKIKKVKKEAKDDLSIPMKVLNPLLKRRKLERKISEIDGAIDEDYVEVFLDAAGQFCMFAPIADNGEAEAEWPDDKAAGTKRSARTKADDDAEQAEGEKALEGAVH